MAKKSGVTPGEILKRLAKVKNAEKARDEADDKYGYTRALKEYNGDFSAVMPSWMQGLAVIPINEVYAFAKTFVPSVYSRDPYIAVNPKGTKFVTGSKMLELAVNAYWRELRIKRQVRKALFDAVFAEGWVKLGYSGSKGLGSIAKGDAEMSVEPNEYVRNNEIFCKRISWKNMVRDVDAVDGLHDARFVAHQIILPLEAVQDSDLYENTDKLQPNFTVEISGKSLNRSGAFYKTQQKFVSLWEEWNQDEEMVYTYAEGCEDYLMKKKWPYHFEGYPFEMIRFNEATDAPYAPNMIGPWEPQLWEKMKLRAMQLDHLKRFGRQYIAEEGAMSKIEEDKLIKGITGSVIKKQQGKPDPTVLQYPPIQADIYGVEGRIDLDKDNVSGQPNAVRSAPQKTHSRTLGEVDRLISAFQSRQNDPQAVVEDFSEEISKKLIGLMQQFFDKDKYIRASAVDGPWLERQAQDNPEADKFDRNGFLLSRKDLQDIDFEVEVRAGSTLPLDRKNRIQSMISVIELGQRIGITDGDKLSRVIGKNLIADFDMPEIMSAYEEVIRKLEAQEKTAMAGAHAMADLQLQKIRGMKQMVPGMAQAAAMHGANGNGGGSGPQIPPEAVG